MTKTRNLGNLSVTINSSGASNTTTVTGNLIISNSATPAGIVFADGSFQSSASTGGGGGGSSGYSGISGFSGYSGISGFSGYSGISGFSGYSGISGFSGYSGISGFSGYSGLGNTPIVSTSSSVTSPLVWNSNTYGQYSINAQAENLTINADAGAPQDGQKTLFRIKDNGTTRTLTWTIVGSKSFRVIGVTLPTATVANKTTYVGCIFNANADTWDVIAVGTEA